MDSAAVVVPIHVHAKVVLSIPVNGKVVVYVENFYKMFGVLLPNVLDAKVVNTERPPVMLLKARCDLALLVAELV